MVKADLGFAKTPRIGIVGAINQGREIEKDAPGQVVAVDYLLASLQLLDNVLGEPHGTVGVTPTLVFAAYIISTSE